MSPWVFNVCMGGCIREMKARVKEFGPRLKVRDTEESLVVGIFAVDIVLLAENVVMLQRIVDEFDKVCKRRRLRVNGGKSKLIVFERKRTGYLQSHTRVRAEGTPKCRIRLREERLEEVTEFEYLGTVLREHGSVEGEVRERAV